MYPPDGCRQEPNRHDMLVTLAPPPRVPPVPTVGAWKSVGEEEKDEFGSTVRGTTLGSSRSGPQLAYLLEVSQRRVRNVVTYKMVPSSNP
jgi:hypothetical protein